MIDTIAPVTRPTAPKLQRLYQDWDDRRQGREFPTRADFAPDELKYILGNLSIVDVTYNPLNFRYRIYGTKLTNRLGKEMTNKSVDEFPSQQHSALARAHFTEVVEYRVPIAHVRYHLSNKSDSPPECEVLVLPLSDDGKTIDRLMVAFEWHKE